MVKKKTKIGVVGVLVLFLLFYYLDSSGYVDMSKSLGENVLDNVLGEWGRYFIHFFDESARRSKTCWIGEVRKIYDGDTLGIYIYNTSHYERVRLKYVDYIDLHPHNRVEKWFRAGVKNISVLEKCYREGNTILRQMIKGKYVCVLQEREGERDKYDRLLGFADVFLNNNKTKMDVGKWVVERGYAMPYLRFGEGERAEEYVAIYNLVKENHEGCLWNTS